jgi:hypothetical protein
MKFDNKIKRSKYPSHTMSNWKVYINHYITWLIKRSKIPNKLYANTNYSRDLLTDASWTASRTLDTERSISAIPEASRLALYWAISTRSSSVCSSTSIHAQLCALHYIAWGNQMLSGRNSRQCPVRLKWLRTDARADAWHSNASCYKTVSMD